MKIIDLLNKIAKGEITKLHKFKWNERIWEEFSKFEEIDNDKSYQENRENGTSYMRFASVCNARCFNDEIEILEEVEDKEYEDIQEIKNKRFTRNQKQIAGKINQIIRNQQKIIKQLENK